MRPQVMLLVSGEVSFDNCTRQHRNRKIQQLYQTAQHRKRIIQQLYYNQQRNRKCKKSDWELPRRGNWNLICTNCNLTGKCQKKFRRPHSTILRISFVKRALSLDVSISHFYQSIALVFWSKGLKLTQCLKQEVGCCPRSLRGPFQVSWPSYVKLSPGLRGKRQMSEWTLKCSREMKKLGVSCLRNISTCYLFT